MKAAEVMQILNISRVTLSKYVRNNYIKVTKLPGGQYIYDPESVFKFIKKDRRKNIIYSRVSTHKQKKDLETQVRQLQTYCNKKKIPIKEVISGQKNAQKQVFMHFNC